MFVCCVGVDVPLPRVCCVVCLAASVSHSGVCGVAEENRGGLISTTCMLVFPRRTKGWKSEKSYRSDPPARRPPILFSLYFTSPLFFLFFFLLILGNNFSLFFYPMRTPILSSFKGGKISNGICVFIFPSYLIFVFELHGVEIIVFYICFSHLFFFSSAC